MRFEVYEQGTIKVNYHALVDNCYELTDYSQQQETLVAQLDSAVLPYLNPSRYCQSDKLYRWRITCLAILTTRSKKWLP
jgi:hypothetical protein